MANFAKTYDKAKPAGDDLISASDTFFRDQWEAIEERQTIEHFSYSSENSGVVKDDVGSAGMHRPGFVSAVKKDTKANLDSGIADLPGRLGLDTTNDLLVINDGNASTGWATDVLQRASGLGVLAFRAFKASNQASVSDDDVITFDTDSGDFGFDYGSDFASSTWTAPFNCLYQMDVRVYWLEPIGGQGADIRFKVRDSAVEGYVGQPGNISGLFKFDSGDTVKVHVNYHTTGDTTLRYTGDSGEIVGGNGAGAYQHTYWSGYCVARL